jgi:IS605 OrfB family transposase
MRNSNFRSFVLDLGDVPFGCARFSPAFDGDYVLEVSWRYWLDHVSLQTISIPYRCSYDDRQFLDELRRVQSAAIRTAYANALHADGSKRSEKDVREIVKSRFTKLGRLDSWAMHCATRVGVLKRKLRPEGNAVFGGRAGLERRRKGLISNDEWKRMRLHPFVSFGDSQKIRGNQNIHLIDETTIIVKIGRKEYGGRSGRTVTQTARIDLARMKGAPGTIMGQLADICAQPEKAHRINVSYSIGDTHVSITFDPSDLPDHPQRRRPVVSKKGRTLGIDLNPNWIGLAVASNVGDAAQNEDTELLEYALVKLGMAVDASPELVRETLAAVCDRAISMARKHRCGTIILEKGLGKLRSSGKSRSLNRLLNYWARTVFVQMLTRRARLAGIEVLEVWAGYSSTIGNLAFDAPDACASATEIARRGIALLAGSKNVLPALEEGCVSRLWKNGKVPAELGSWQDVHRTIKAAKIGYRRPHPDVPIGARGSDVHGTKMFCGHAVVRLGRRHRPGLLFRMATGRPDAAVRIL